MPEQWFFQKVQNPKTRRNRDCPVSIYTDSRSFSSIALNGLADFVHWATTMKSALAFFDRPRIRKCLGALRTFFNYSRIRPYLGAMSFLEGCLLLAYGSCLCLEPAWFTASLAPQVNSFYSCLLGFIFIALAIQLFLASVDSETKPASAATDPPHSFRLVFRRRTRYISLLLVLNAFLPILASLVFIIFEWMSPPNWEPAVYWWFTLILLLVVIVTLYKARVFCIRWEPEDWGNCGAVNDQDLAQHALKLKYAWDWFQYHADQRLKSFNFFVLAIGILIAAYGAAMKEAQPPQRAVEEPIAAKGAVAGPTPIAHRYEVFAAGVASCGMLIAIAFLTIEIRNTELVDCGRVWLDYLEGGLEIYPRNYDKHRLCLPGALGLAHGLGIRAYKSYAHKVWFRILYISALIGFAWAFAYARNGFL